MQLSIEVKMIGWGVDCYKISRDATGKYKDARDSIAVTIGSVGLLVGKKWSLKCIVYL